MRLQLACRAGFPASDRSPVRIFIGSEPAQHRAERVLLWSIERHRDPGRRYEITILRDLPGFQRRRWTTGFTNYRFAVPHLAEGRGLALYNDVDQIYRTDPAELLDGDLGDHGFLAVTADDSSVMLVDCARMAATWTLDAARTASKRALAARARGHWGALDPAWNATCNAGVRGHEKLIHYTVLHTQPWRPFPERYVYLRHPAAECWQALEYEADAARYQPFGRESPAGGSLRPGDGERSSPRSATPAKTAAPRTWVLLDDRPGNASQARGLANALGVAWTPKHLHFRAAAALHARLLGASLLGLDAAKSDPLAPPWPDLVIAAGRRTAPVAEWIRARSDGKARLVMLGRKAGDDADRFDLCVTPRTARLLPHPRRLETTLPLHEITEDHLVDAREVWAEFGALPGPRLALLAGGDTGQYRLDPAMARRIGEQARAWAHAWRGSLLVTTSRRLSPASTKALREALAGAAFVHCWRPDAARNPYLGLLGWADAFAVTGDSETMLAEACSTGAPVFVIDLPERASYRGLTVSREWIWRRLHATRPGPRGTPRPQRTVARLCGRLFERGWLRPARSLGRLHAHLYERGIARPFPERSEFGLAPPKTPVEAPDDLGAVTERVRAMLWERRSAPTS